MSNKNDGMLAYVEEIRNADMALEDFRESFIEAIPNPSYDHIGIRWFPKNWQLI